MTTVEHRAVAGTATPLPHSPPAETGTLDGVVIVRTRDYWESVASTLTSEWRPKYPGLLILHVVSSENFEEVRRQLYETSLYYQADWELELGNGPVLHDDMIVADDTSDTELVDLVRTEVAARRVDVVENIADIAPSGPRYDIELAERRTWVSLGGWCGPALGLKCLTGRQPRGAFDFLLSSLAGVDRAILGDGGGYVPPRPFPLVDVIYNRAPEIEERGILGPEAYRMPDFIHVHERFDIDPDVWESLDRRLARTREDILSHVGPLFLLRTVTGLDWEAERDGLVDFAQRLEEANPRCTPHVVAILHSQHRATVRVPPMAPGIDTWAVQGSIGRLDTEGLPHDRYIAEYARVIQRVAHDHEYSRHQDSWPPPPDLPRHEIHDHHEHWIF